MAPNPLANLPSNTVWHLLVDAAKQALGESGYALHRVPGRGLSNVWLYTVDGQRGSASIRTSRNRWFAFPPLEGGTRWKTLDDVDQVVVAALDHADNPLHVEIYVFDAPTVRERFDAAYAARTAAGHRVKDDYGMWINLDRDDRGAVTGVGSGLAQEFPAVATYRLGDLAERSARVSMELSRSLGDNGAGGEPATIANVVAAARERVAAIAGVGLEAVKVDVRIEY